MSGTSEGTVSSPSVVQIWLIPKQHGEAISRNYKTSMKIGRISAGLLILSYIFYITYMFIMVEVV